MTKTFRKVEMSAAAFYAAAFALWVLGREDKAFEPEEGIRCVFCSRETYLSTIDGWVYLCLVLLVIAVGLTIAAVRLRNSSAGKT
jgi:hypothetical protein